MHGGGTANPITPVTDGLRGKSMKRSHHAFTLVELPRGHCDYRSARRPAASGDSSGTRIGSQKPMHQQPEANWPSDSPIRAQL